VAGSDEYNKYVDEEYKWETNIPYVNFVEFVKYPLIVNKNLKNVPVAGYAIGANFSGADVFRHAIGVRNLSRFLARVDPRRDHSRLRTGSCSLFIDNINFPLSFLWAGRIVTPPSPSPSLQKQGEGG
jgi:hypothetical protein